ncbi:MAG: hypothetical protein NTU72_02630, partial [Fimbriimonadales bacterium]|nr:hypothetical protein [Fimbriimonadales bacterium]
GLGLLGWEYWGSLCWWIRCCGNLCRFCDIWVAAMDGKGMAVCMSRRICIDLYRAIVELRPEWDSQDDAEGAVKIIMTGSASDPEERQDHIRSKARREEIALRFKNPSDPLKLVIVRDMWLTGFDAPCMHTMYIDKPMKGHGLMQAIARVNRVFKDKPGGLVVDYLGLADQDRRRWTRARRWLWRLNIMRFAATCSMGLIGRSGWGRRRSGFLCCRLRKSLF